MEGKQQVHILVGEYFRASKVIIIKKKKLEERKIFLNASAIY